MKKKLSLIIVLLLTAFIGLFKLNASSGYFMVTTSRNNVVVGNEFYVTVTASSDARIGSLEFSISYDSSKVKLVSGDPVVVRPIEGLHSSSYYYTFQAIASGSSVVTVKSYNMGDLDTESFMSVSAGSETITAITQADLEASYSKNNNLSSLSINSYELKPAFSVDTLEYTVSVPSEVTKVVISGEVEDNYASASGFGEFEVSEGENKFEITVTAQNGSTKTYSIKVNVEDNNPIETSIDGITYTVVKRASTINSPSSSYTAKTIKINGQEVPAFYSEITSYTLVGLKDKEGNINLYIYDEKNNKYTLYKEVKTSSIILYLTETKEVPKFYKKTKIKLNDEEVVAYQYENRKDYYIVHGVNIENNEEGFYLYDIENNSVTKYNDDLLLELLERNENYLMIIMLLGAETLVVTLILLISLTKNKRRRKKALKEYELRKKDKEKKEQLNQETKDIKEEKEVNNKINKHEEKDLQKDLK